MTCLVVGDETKLSRNGLARVYTRAIEAPFSKFAYVYAIAKTFNTTLRRYQAKFKSYVNEMVGQSTIDLCSYVAYKVK